MQDVTEKDVLINRTQMLRVAREYKIFVSKSTVHRWANKPDFPYPIGQQGQNLLYSHKEFITYLKRKLMKIQFDH